MGLCEQSPLRTVAKGTPTSRVQREPRLILGEKLAQAGILTFGNTEHNYPSVDQKGWCVVFFSLSLKGIEGILPTARFLSQRPLLT